MFNFAHLVILLMAFLSVNSFALDMGTDSDACVANANCSASNIVQALLLTQDIGVYLACAMALFFGFSLGLRMTTK